MMASKPWQDTAPRKKRKLRCAPLEGAAIAIARFVGSASWAKQGPCRCLYARALALREAALHAASLPCKPHPFYTYATGVTGFLTQSEPSTALNVSPGSHSVIAALEVATARAASKKWMARISVQGFEFFQFKL